MPPPHLSDRVRPWEWVQTGLLVANLAWTTLCLGGFLASTMIVTSALTAALLAVHAIGLVVDRRPVHRAGLWLLPFLAYAAANVAWVTPVRWLGWIDWFNWAQLIAVFWIVLNGIQSRRAQAALFGALLALGLVSVWLACYQRFVQPSWLMLGRTQADQFVGRASGPFGIPNSMAAMLLLLIPAVGALAVRRHTSLLARIFFGWVLLVFIFGLALTISRGAWLGLAVALTVWPLVGLRRGWGRRLVAAIAVIAAIAAAGAAWYATSPLVRERFTQLARDLGERSRPILWRAAWQMFREHPVVGTGAGSFNVRFEQYRPEGFLLNPVWAHNDYLNTLSDYGALGWVLFFGAAAVVTATAWRATRRPIGESADGRISAVWRRDWLDDPLVRQALGIGLLAFALQLFVDFHFKIPALAMAFACVAALLLSRLWPTERSWRGSPARWIAAIVAAGIAVGVAVEITPLYRGEALRFRAREAMDRMANVPLANSVVRARLIDIRQWLDRAVALAPSDGQAWADRSYATAQWFRIDAAADKSLGTSAEADADRAIALSPIIAEFWVRRGVALDIEGRWAEAGPVFAQAIVLSPNAVLPSYYYAYHMSLRRTGLDMAEATVEFCLRLDPTNPEALRLRQRLATSRSGS